MGASTIGQRELALLRHIADAGGATVGEVAETFGRDHGLARSTVLTMMERLRQKGRLARRLTGGVYRYRTRHSSAELLRAAVKRFVDRHLDGSISPFVAYLSDTGELSDDELRELAALVERLQADRRVGKRGRR
jgi:predicted transcriptional regulator